MTDSGATSVSTGVEVSIFVSSIGTLDVLNDAPGADIYDPFVSRAIEAIGFGRMPGDLLNSAPNAAFSAFDLQSSLVPVDTTFEQLQWASLLMVETDMGTLVFDNGPNVPRTFLSIVRVADVPVPVVLPLLLAGLGGLGLLARRRSR